MQEGASLLDILIDGFEKNEVWRGFHWRQLPMLDEDAAKRQFATLAEEATRWKGAPVKCDDSGPRRLAIWPDLEIRQAGRGVMLLVKAPNFDRWWHDSATWSGDPMKAIFDWIQEGGPEV